MNRTISIDLQPLTDYLLAVESGDGSVDDQLDYLIAKIPMPQLAVAISDLLTIGPPSAWIGSVELVGLLGNENPQLWPILIDAIQYRTADCIFAANSIVRTADSTVWPSSPKR